MHDHEHDEPPPLSGPVRAYVDAFADDERPRARDRAAGWRAIEAALAEERRRSPWRWLATGGLVAALAAAAVVLLGGLRGATLRRAPTEPAVQVPWEGRGAHEGGAVEVEAGGRVADDAPPSATPAPSAGAGSTVGERPVEPASAPAGARRRRAPAAAEDASPSTSTRAEDSGPTAGPSTPSLAEEIALVREATLALRGGDSDGALARLDDHRERFAKGALQREVTVLRAETLCALDRRDEAVALRDRFVADHPGSPLVARMRAVCP